MNNAPLTGSDTNHAADDGVGGDPLLRPGPVPLHDSIVPLSRGRGRPPLITLDVVKDVGALIAKGLTEEQACLRVGINHSSFRTARHRHEEFETAIKDCQAEFVDMALDKIAKGVNRWQSLAWLLERRHGEQFRQKQGIEMSGQLGTVKAIDQLRTKPLAQWTKADLDASVGAWKILKKWSKEQLRELTTLYSQHWGDVNQWSSEQLEWCADIELEINVGTKARLRAMVDGGTESHLSN